MSLTLTVPATNVQGTVITPSAVIPAGTTEVDLTLTMTDALASDPTTTGRLVIELSFDNGATWKTWGRSTYQGGSKDSETGAWVRPMVGLMANDPSVLSGRRIRAILDIPTVQRLGAVIEVF